MREGARLRSLLFVPADRPDRAAKALASRADAVILDLEDAVAPTGKGEGRGLAAQVVRERSPGAPALFARTNGWGSGHLVDDVHALVGQGLDGLVLPKAEAPDEVAALDRLVTELELQRGLPVGRIEVVPMVESAAGLRHLYDLARASARVRRAPGVQHLTPGGDLQRSLGVRWTPEGREMLALDSRVVVDVRAAGVEHVIGSTGPELRDLDAVRESTRRSRDAGADGVWVMHPSHVPVVHEVFGPSPAEVEQARELLVAFAGALAEGTGVLEWQGRVVDRAHARSSLAVLAEAAAAGLEVGDLPALDLD